MSRAEYVRAYQALDGRIPGPGPFQGQKVYVPYFWEAYLRGDAHDVSSDDLVLFVITNEDLREFPELENRSVIRLRQSKDGRIEEA